MAAELGLLSLTQLQKLSQPQQNQHQLNPRAWMWNQKQAQQQEDDESWEVKAFAEDTGNILGTTWPPRSYTCTFCRREFRSAQALGGHMNVHRRDRARLHQAQPNYSGNIPTSSPNSNTPFIIPTQEFLANGGGLCLLYQLPNYNAAAFTTSSPINSTTCIDQSPSTLLSISPYASPPTNFPLETQPGTNSSSSYYSPTTDNYNNIEDLDLELRLGQRPMPS